MGNKVAEGKEGRGKGASLYESVSTGVVVKIHRAAGPVIHNPKYGVRNLREPKIVALRQPLKIAKK